MKMTTTLLLLSSFLFTLALSQSISKIHVDPATGNFVDASGRVRMFRGINSVLKRPPWYYETMLDPARLASLREMGFNVVRLGAMWTGVQPEEAGKVNVTYLAVLQDIVSSLSDLGIHTLLDMHQDVLWQAGPADNSSGYWGTPPWLKHSLPAPDHYFPYPMAPDRWFAWPCGYFTEEISKGFDHLFRNTAGASDAFADLWRFLAGVFAGQDAVLGYEMINEPWVGDIHKDASYLLPGVAGRENLAPLYEKVHSAIREMDEETLVFWEPVTWGYIAPFAPDLVFDTVVEDLLKQYSIMDLLDILSMFCGEMDPTIVPDDGGNALTTFKKIFGAVMQRSRQGYNDWFGRSSSQAVKKPSVFGPGFTAPPGGPDYRNRTVLSWHYYCWALGETGGGDAPYDPDKRALCDESLGPMTFGTVQQRAGEIGGSAVMLTEFGLCSPNINFPDSQGSAECNFVITSAEQRLQSWVYWDTADGDVLWDASGAINPEVAFMFSRPFPRATAGVPLALAFDPYSKVFQYDFSADASGLATEVFVPKVHYPGGAYEVETSDDLEWEVDPADTNVLLFFSDGGDTNGTSTIWIRPT